MTHDATSYCVHGRLFEVYSDFFARLERDNQGLPQEVVLDYADFRELWGNAGLVIHPAMQKFDRNDAIILAFDGGPVTFRCGT